MGMYSVASGMGRKLPFESLFKLNIAYFNINRQIISIILLKFIPKTSDSQDPADQ
jgi:uncharacterized membrane protein